MEEEWREIFDGIYEVSNFGRVRRKTAGKGTRAGRMLIALRHKSNRGGWYQRVSLWYQNKKTDAYIHRLVAEAFIGPCPQGREVNHKDGNSENNHADNLEYLTHAENNQHFHLLHRGIISGENNWNAKLREVDVKAIRILLKARFPQMYIAKLFDVRQSTIEKIGLGLRWKSVFIDGSNS